MSAKSEETRFGDELIEALEEALAWTKGEIALPVLNVPDDYPVGIRSSAANTRPVQT